MRLRGEMPKVHSRNLPNQRYHDSSKLSRFLGRGGFAPARLLARISRLPPWDDPDAETAKTSLVEPEVGQVVVLHDVLLGFQTLFAGAFGFGLAA